MSEIERRDFEFDGDDDAGEAGGFDCCYCLLEGCGLLEGRLSLRRHGSWHGSVSVISRIFGVFWLKFLFCSLFHGAAPESTG